MQRTGAGGVDAVDRMSIGQLLQHIVELCSSMESTCESGAHGRPDDLLTLLAQERSALLALERRMDAALSDHTVPADLEDRLDELEEAHRRCQEALKRRSEITRVALGELSALRNGHESYHEQEP